MPRCSCRIWIGSLMAAAVALAACSSGSGKGAGPSGQNPNATESNVPGDIPDNQAFVPFADPGGSFTVTVPEGWARTTSGSGVSFTDKYNSILVQSKSSSIQPTVQVARRGELPAIEASGHNVRPGTVRTVSRKAGSAVLITYQADSARNPVTGKVAVEAVERYEFWKAGREVVLTLASPVGSDNVDPWRTITDSFHWSK